MAMLKIGLLVSTGSRSRPAHLGCSTPWSFKAISNSRWSFDELPFVPIIDWVSSRTLLA